MGAFLDFAAVVLPTFLAVAGVLISIETPKVESTRGRWAIRGGLIAFGILVSVVTAWQQKISRDDSAEVKVALVSIADALKIKGSSSAQEIAQEILKKLPSGEWHLSVEEREKLGRALEAVPQADRFTVDVHALIGSSQSQMFKDDLAIAIDAHGWKATGGVDTGVRSDLVGLYIIVKPEVKTEKDLPKEAVAFGKLLRQAGVRFAYGHGPAAGDGFLLLYVGTKWAD
jgi:hypothetical protein